MDRRKFLRRAGQGLTLSALMELEARFSKATPAAPLEEEQILILGAGAAGLGAAQALRDKGKRVLVLEARDRIGGRVWTDRSWPDMPLDLGAAWVQGTKGNPLIALCKSLNLKTYTSDASSRMLYDRQGKPYAKRAELPLTKHFEDLAAELDLARSALEDAGGKDTSLQQAIDRTKLVHSLSPGELQELQYAYHVGIEQAAGADASELSLLHWSGETDRRGEDLLLPEGYDALMQSLAMGLEIRLNHLVTRISIQRGGLQVTTDKGVFTADRCIVTLPLGVLKSGQVVFSPVLPKPMLTAQHNLAMGVLDKVFLRFPNVFWPEADLLGYVGENRGEWAHWINLAKATGKPILAAFLTGSFARSHEKLTDAAIVV